MNARIPIILKPGEGNALNVLGDTVTIKINSDETGGKYSVIEISTPPNGGSPLHVHHREDELFYVLEGDYEMYCGGRKFHAKAGSMAFLPKNMPHSFRNIGKSVGRILGVITPGGFEKFFEELDLISKHRQPSAEQLFELVRKYDLELLPSPEINH